MIDSLNKTKSTDDWIRFARKDIPSSLELDPVIFDYLEKDFKVLDVGCGFGKTLFELEKLGHNNLVGVDINPSGIIKAKASIKDNKNLNFITGDANKLGFKDKAFNFVITQAFWTTITNKRDRLIIAKEINRVLKVGGMIYFADFGRTWNNPHYKNAYLQGREDGLELGTFKAYNKVTGEFMYLAHHHTKNELSELLKESGFSKSFFYKSTIFTTQSGNKIKGCILISKKITHENDKNK